MLVSGIIFSTVAIFLGFITKLPQGGGGLTKNLIALTFFLPAPQLPPTPLQNRIFFNLEASIAETRLFYLSNPVVTSNGTNGPMPRPPCSTPSSSPDNATFTSSTFDSSAFSLPTELIQYWASIGTAIMMLVALCLPWLVIKKISILGKMEPAPQVAIRPTEIGFGPLVAQIEPLNPLFEDLKIIISERDQASANLWSNEKQAWEVEKKAKEKDARNKQIIEVLCSERRKLLKELDEGKELQTKMGKEIKEEAKAWAEKIAILEKEKKEAVDELHERASSQTKIWTEKERNWEHERAKEKQRHNEVINSLKMNQERDTESWRIQVEDLKKVQKGEKQALSAQLKKFVEKMEEEREGWRREKEKFEEKRIEEENSWANANECAQRRIADLEAENRSLKYSETRRQKQTAEAEAAMKAVEAEKEQGQKRAEDEAKESIAKLKKEVLNGQTLIDDLLADKRKDRQLLLELRAQLVRPTHFAPPHHMNPSRFGGTAFSLFRERPIIPGNSASSPTTGNPTLPIGNPISGFNPHTATSLPSPPTSSRPTVRLPPQPSSNPALLPASF